MRIKQAVQSTLIASVAWFGVGCGTIEFPMNLEVAPGSFIAIDQVFNGIPVPPPNNLRLGILEGGVEMNMVIDVTHLFSRRGLVALVEVNDLLMASPGFKIGAAPLPAGLPTGNICVGLNAGDPGGGAAYIRPIQGEVDFDIVLSATGRLANPVLAALLPDGLPFSADVQATIPLSFSDLLALAFGGGDSGGIEITQLIEEVLDPDIPLLGGSIFAAAITLRTTNIPLLPPANLRLQICKDLLDSL